MRGSRSGWRQQGLPPCCWPFLTPAWDSQFAHHLAEPVRSSARSMVSGDVPMIRTPAFSSSPRYSAVSGLRTGRSRLLAFLFRRCSERPPPSAVRNRVCRRCRNQSRRFRVAVDHDGLITCVPDSEGRMYAAVVEFDALTDPVGSAAQDHDLLPVADRHLVRAVVRGIIIGRIFHATDGTASRLRPHPGLSAASGYPFPGRPESGRDSGPQSRLSCRDQQVIRQRFAPVLTDFSSSSTSSFICSITSA